MFARIYDALMADVDYEQLYQWIESKIQPTDTIIDVGCGSGNLLIEFAKKGYPIIGIDSSSEMLGLADEKLRQHHLKSMLFEHDIRYPFHIKSDVIYMMFDVINYFKGAKTVLAHCYHALEDQGRLIFDVYKESVLDDFHHYDEEEFEPFHYRWKIRCEQSKMIHDVDVDGYHERIVQYIYPLAYYIEILEHLGLTDEVTDGPDERKHYMIAYKL